MVRLLRLFTLSLLAFSAPGLHAQRAARAYLQPADAVNPLIGTAKSTQRTVWESNGATFPGVLAPFGMVQIAPDGYRYADTQIKGFSYLDHSSGWSAGGSFLVLPYTGPIASPSSFSHKRESSHPWQYDVDLPDYHIHAAFTATTHTGLARFTFPASTEAHIVLSGVSNITPISDTVLTGQCRGTWFITRFSKAFRVRNAQSGTSVYLDFTTAAGETIELRTGFSRTSTAAAAANLRSEVADNDFIRISRQARAIWNQFLGRITIKGGSAVQRIIFYTALYHSSFAPAILSDATETPRRYAPLYPWDTYRSEHPLITLLDPDAEGEMIASTLAEYDRTGWLPTGNMLGNHNVELILDSYTKGIRNFDIAKAGEAIRKSLTKPPYARRDMALYNALGYVPASRVNSVSQTLEFAYNDWAAATFLRATGGSTSIDTLLDRSFNYQHVYDPETGFMRAKTADPDAWTDGGFCEGTPWTYSFYVPHDVRGLIHLMGGRAAFSAKLDRCFKEGHYVHDNEPPLHYAYLYDFDGEPWKTQQWARQITETSYSNAPGGLPGNDDLGALSSWYVLSAMGFYPVTPGRPLYELGSPIFSSCTLHLPNGKDFTISAPGSSARNRYIQSASLNGHPYQRPWISHQDILSGGTMAFVMGPVPNKHWGAAPDNAPPSQTTGQPDFHIGTPSLTTSPGTDAEKASPAAEPTHPTAAGDTVYWSSHIINTGTSTGSMQVALFVDGHPYSEKSILLEMGEKRQISIPVTIYLAGRHTITVGKTGFPQRLIVQARPPALLFTDLTIPLPPVLLRKDNFIVSAKVKNTGSSTTNTIIILYVDHQPVQTKHVAIEPGQQKTIHFTIAGANCAPRAMIGIGDLPPLAIRLLDPSRPAVPDTGLLRQLGAIFYTPIIHGTPKWVPGLFGEAVQLNATRGNYIELKPTKALDSLAHSDSMTMMAWIYPTEEENFSDIICRGDWATLQLKASNTMINFFTGGWEGHEAVAMVPEGWNRHWHHIAGVTRAPFEELYVDGRLIATKHMEPRDPHGETGLADYSNHPWSIGRNENDPTRIFKGYISEPMLFRKALSQEEISRVMMH